MCMDRRCLCEVVYCSIYLSLQLKDTKCDNDMAVLMREDSTLDILHRCGITAALTVRAFIFYCIGARCTRFVY